jgi:hypothetical protein
MVAARCGAVVTERRDRMQRISSRWTFSYKRVFPLVMLGALAAFLAVPLAKGDVPPLQFILITIGMMGFMYTIMRKLIFDLVDEVWDAGEALIVRNRKQEDRIPLSAIMNVDYSPLVSPPRVTLTLRTPSIFGETVVFCAPIRAIPFQRSPIVDDLIRRIDAARMRAR